MSQHGSTRTLLTVCALVAAVAGFMARPAVADMRFLKGQTVYVPVYSHIYSGDREQPFYLAATLSIRNTDLTHVIKLTAVDYYDSDGKFLKHYLDKAFALNAMATKRYVVPESDKSGGSGAKIHHPLAIGSTGCGTADRIGDDQHQDPAGHFFYFPGAGA